MSAKIKYTVEEMITLYVKKTEELGRIPRAADINRDPDMPAYITYLRKIGNIDEINRRARLNKKYLNQVKINNQFCNDCLYDPRNCGRDIEDCKAEAELYFRMLDGQAK